MVKKTEVTFGKVYVLASFNNTLVTVTDEEGRTISWGSSGKVGFKGTRKATPFAATTAVDQVIKDAREKTGLKEVEVYIKGPGPGRDAALRAIKAAGVKISMIADVTPMPHDGPRPKRKGESKWHVILDQKIDYQGAKDLTFLAKEQNLPGLMLLLECMDQRATCDSLLNMEDNLEKSRR